MGDPIDKRIEQVNIHLLKSSVTDFKRAIAKGKSPKHLQADSSILPNGILYYQAPPPRRAGWRDFLAPGFGADLPPFPAQHASAVLFFKAGRRSFAVTFGYGRSLLAESALEADFGLRAALNLCDPGTLRTVNYRTIEERTRIGRIQLSEAGSVNAFRINMDTDLLRGLEAESNDKSVCERLGARWSNLIVAARVEIGDLPKLAKKLLDYQKKKLPKEYQWVENVRRVTDPEVIAALDTELERRLNAQEYDGIRLASPEIAGSTVGIDAKLFKENGDDFTSCIKTYLAKRPKQMEWRISTAKTSHHVVLVDSNNGKERESVAIYRCIVAEFSHEEDLYLLADGEWFRLDKHFVNAVNKAIAQIPVLTHKLPVWNSGEPEGEWNKRACEHWADAALLDKTNISHGGGHSRIEPADILTKDRVLAHAKRIDKNSAGLSHLFAQGVVSAQLISQDAEFRGKVASCIPKSHKPLVAQLNGQFSPHEWTIGYVLLGADSQRPAERLPFFSKVNLKGAVERLRVMQYGVGLIGVCMKN